MLLCLEVKDYLMLLRYAAVSVDTVVGLTLEQIIAEFY